MTADADYCIIRRIVNGQDVRRICASRDRGRLGLLEEAIRYPITQTHPAAVVMAHPAAMVVPRLRLAALGIVMCNSQHYMACRQLRVASVMTVPIWVDDRAVGTLAMMSRSHRYRLSTLRLAMQYADEAAALFAQKWPEEPAQRAAGGD